MAHDHRSAPAEVALRVLSPADLGQIERGFRQLGAESRRLRYGLPLADVGRALEWVARLGDGKDFAVGACAIDTGEPVGVARYVRGYEAGEVAVTVVDRWQGRGVGTLLLETLVRHAARHGIHSLRASVLVDNVRAVRLLRRLGAQRSGFGGGLLEYELAVGPESVDRPRCERDHGRQIGRGAA